MGAAKEMIYGTFFNKNVGVKLEDGYQNKRKVYISFFKYITYI